MPENVLIVAALFFEKGVISEILKLRCFVSECHVASTAPAINLMRV